MNKEKEQNTKPTKTQDIKQAVFYYAEQPLTIFFVCFIAAILLNVIMPLYSIPFFLSFTLGCILMLMAWGVFYWAHKHIRLNGGEWNIFEMETPVLIVFGPYHYTRNPIFIAAIFAFGALFILLDNLWGLVLIPLLMILISKFIISKREEYFLAEYGEIYEDYHTKTSRWM